MSTLNCFVLHTNKQNTLNLFTTMYWFSGEIKKCVQQCTPVFQQNKAALFVKELLGLTFYLWKANLCK